MTEPTRTSIFLDLDGLLVRSYSGKHAETCDDDFFADAASHFDGVRSKKRPFAAEFLEVASRCGDLYLFTSAQPGYAKAVLKAHGLDRFFRRFFSSVYYGRNSLAREMNLYGRAWLLIDDSPPDHHTVKHKLAALGLDVEVNPAGVDRHFVQIASYVPHENRDDQELVKAAETLPERVKMLERRTIRY